MPSSYIESIEPIIWILMELDPHFVVDVGPGWGKYGLLCREYMPHLEEIDAVEVPQGFISSQACVYDNLFLQDVRSFDLWGGYDTVLMIDVIEHMSKEDGINLLKKIIDNGCRVLVATPREFFTQHVDGNPHEDHICLWTQEDFKQFKELYNGSTTRSWIYALGE